MLEWVLTVVMRCFSGGPGVLEGPEAIWHRVRQHHGYPSLLLLHVTDQRSCVLLPLRTLWHHLLPHLQDHPTSHPEDQRGSSVQVSLLYFLPKPPV